MQTLRHAALERAYEATRLGIERGAKDAHRGRYRPESVVFAESRDACSRAASRLGGRWTPGRVSSSVGMTSLGTADSYFYMDGSC